MIGDGASLLVDTLWDRRLTRRMLAAMAPLSRRADLDVVNTHSDGDHWWGNSEVAAEIVATDAAAAVMAQQSTGEMKRFGALAAALRRAGSLPVPYPRRADVATIAAYVGEALAPFEFGEVRLVPPARTFSGELTLDVGGREVRLIEVGPAHTPGDLIAWVPDARDRARGRHPVHRRDPIMWAGPVEGWIAALERMLDARRRALPPGHGPVCGPGRSSGCSTTGAGSTGRPRSSAALGRSAGASASPACRRWLAPERALVNITNRRGAAGPPGPREIVGAFFRMALIARDLR